MILQSNQGRIVPRQLPSGHLARMPLEGGKLPIRRLLWGMPNRPISKSRMQKLPFPASRRGIPSVTTGGSRELASRVDSAKQNAVVTPLFVANVEN
jgi:hypothetical protein